MTTTSEIVRSRSGSSTAFIDPGTLTTLIKWLLSGDVSKQLEGATQVFDVCRGRPEEIWESGLLGVLVHRLDRGAQAAWDKTFLTQQVGLDSTNKSPVGVGVLLPNDPPNERINIDVMLCICNGLAQLAANNKEARRAVRNENGLQTLALLLKKSRDEGITLAATKALENIAVDDINKDVLRESGVLEPLMAMLEAGPDSQISRHALGCLVNLHSSNPANQRAMLDKGIAPLLQAFVLVRRNTVATYRARTLLTSLSTSDLPINNVDNNSILDLMLAESVQDKTQAVEWLDRWLKSEQAKLSIAKATLASSAASKQRRRAGQRRKTTPP